MKRTQYWLLGSLAMVAACSASQHPAPTPAPETSASSEQSQRIAMPVQVDNQNFSDMNIYYVSGGQRWLIGQAGGLTESTLTIPSGVVPADGRVRLEAAAIGGTRPIFTPELVVGPGQTVYWTIGSDPEMSTASVG